MRYIDADKLREEWLENGENEYVYDTNSVLDSIDSQPTADVVEVVRCKDCELYSGKYCRLTDDTEDRREPDDYCSYGTHARQKKEVGEVNILEHYIEKVHGIKEFEKYPDMIEVDVTCNCYGSIQRVKHLTDKKKWQIDLEKGYFMA